MSNDQEQKIKIIFAATNGYVDGILVEEVKRFEEELFSYLEMKYSDIFTSIAEQKEITDETKDKLNKALDEFIKTFKTEAE